jgi:uncharacterized membrane protein
LIPALLLVVTASVLRADDQGYFVMVPPIFPLPDLLVTVTGALEILGALGLFIPGTARGAGICLALLLIALFPVNIHAAREKLTIAGQPVPGLPV